jgi:hypothetical protein
VLQRAGAGERCVGLSRVQSPPIGILFSGLVARLQLAFFWASPDSTIVALRDCRDTAPRRSRQAGQRLIIVA